LKNGKKASRIQPVGLGVHITVFTGRGKPNAAVVCLASDDKTSPLNPGGFNDEGFLRGPSGFLID